MIDTSAQTEEHQWLDLYQKSDRVVLSMWYISSSTPKPESPLWAKKTFMTDCYVPLYLDKIRTEHLVITKSVLKPEWIPLLSKTQATQITVEHCTMQS
jgi:hypothetical protein